MALAIVAGLLTNGFKGKGRLDLLQLHLLYRQHTTTGPFAQ